MSYHKVDLKRKLLELSIDIIAKQGIKKLTIAYLAKKLDISQPAIYRHYTSKNALLCEVIACAYRDLSSELDIIQNDNSKDCINKIISIGITYVFFGLKNPAKYKFMFSEEIQTANMDSNLQNDLLYCFNHLVVEFKNAQKEGSLSSNIDINTMSNLYWSLGHGLTCLLIDNQMVISSSGLPEPTAGIKNPINGNEHLEKYLDTTFRLLIKGFQD